MAYIITHEVQDGSGVRKIWRDPENQRTILTLDNEFDAWAAASAAGLKRPMVEKVGGKK